VPSHLVSSKPVSGTAMGLVRGDREDPELRQLLHDIDGPCEFALANRNAAGKQMPGAIRPAADDRPSVIIPLAALEHWLRA